MSDPKKTDPYTIEIIQHKLQSQPVGVGMEKVQNIIDERIDQGYSRRKALLYGAKAIANRAVSTQNKNLLQYISQIRTANNTNYAQTESGLKIIQEAISTIDRLNNQRDEANNAKRRREKDEGDEDIKTRFATWSFLPPGPQKDEEFKNLREHALRQNRSSILKNELFYQQEIEQINRDKNIQYNSWEDKVSLIKQVYKDNASFYKSNPDQLKDGVLGTLRSHNIYISPEDKTAIEEYIKGWVSISDTDGYKDIIKIIESEASGYVKQNIAATEGKQGKVSEPSNMASIIEKHTDVAQEALQVIFEDFMEKNKDKNGNYIKYTQWENKGEFGKEALESAMRARLDTILQSEGENSLKSDLKTAIESVEDTPKTKEQKFNDWRENYNNASDDKKQRWVDSGLESSFSDLVEPYIERIKTADQQLKALPIKFLDVGSKPEELDLIFAKLDELAPLGSGGQRRGIEKFARDNQMQFGQTLQDQINSRIASSKDLRELKVWKDVVSHFNSTILSKFPNWRPPKIDLERLLVPKRGEVGLPDEAVKRISELAGDLEVVLATEYVNFISGKEGFKEYGDWTNTERAKFNSEIRGEVREFFTPNILKELEVLSGIKKDEGKAKKAKNRQRIKRAYYQVTGRNLQSNFSTDEKNEYRSTLSSLTTDEEDDQEELVDLYNKIENKQPPEDWSHAKIKIHLLEIGNLEYK